MQPQHKHAITYFTLLNLPQCDSRIRKGKLDHELPRFNNIVSLLEFFVGLEQQRRPHVLAIVTEGWEPKTLQVRESLLERLFGCVEFVCQLFLSLKVLKDGVDELL